MTKNYSQLTLEQRYQIEALKEAGHNQTVVAQIVGVDKSTISREYKRNIPKRGTGAKVYIPHYGNPSFRFMVPPHSEAW